MAWRHLAIKSRLIRNLSPGLCGEYSQYHLARLLTRSMMLTSNRRDQSSPDLQPPSPPLPPQVQTSSKGETFETLFENSQFVRIMNPVGKRVKGEIIAVVGDNLYVDFGCKFHAVVKIPEDGEKELYRKGGMVVVVVKSLELTDHFLGASKHISLLEAEAELIGPLSD